VRDSAVLKALAVAVQLPELASPRFEECRMEFEVAGGVARTPVLRLRGPALELTGKGTYGLATSGLDYDMTLALSPELLSRIPGNTTRAAFKKREDGFGTLDFGVTGTAADPKVDLVSRLGMSLATEAAKEGLRKLFRKKSN
jgi:AsmA-like C-terminal region